LLSKKKMPFYLDTLDPTLAGVAVMSWIVILMHLDLYMCLISWPDHRNKIIALHDTLSSLSRARTAFCFSFSLDRIFDFNVLSHRQGHGTTFPYLNYVSFSLFTVPVSPVSCITSLTTETASDYARWDALPRSPRVSHHVAACCEVSGAFNMWNCSHSGRRFS